MPSKTDKINLPEQYDRRRKLGDEQKTEIRQKYSTGYFSLNGLAKEYGVSKKTILLIVNQESKRKNDDRIKRCWRQYVGTKQDRAQIMREHRAYKRRLFNDGKIGNNS